MSDITLINDSEQSSLVTNGLAKNGELYLKKAGSTDAGAIVVYDSGSWRTFANEYSAGFSNAYSVDFDGTNDYMDCGSIVSSFSGLSVSAWVNSDSFGVFNVVASQYTANSGGAFFLETVGTQMWFALSNGSGYTGLAKYTTALSTGTWYHVVGTWDGSTTKVYINGSLGSQTGSYSGSLGGSSVSLKVGSMLDGYWNGKIDEVAVFNSGLSASAVSSIYNSGSPADLSSYSPVSWWTMGDNNSGAGTTITDQGSGSNNGTLTNGPTFSTDIPS